MGLKDLVASFGSEGVAISSMPKIADLVTAQILSRREADQKKRRPGFHISSFFDFCPRRWLFDLYFPETKKDLPTAEDYRIWNLGHIVHDLYQNVYLGPEQLIEGEWKCMACLTVAVGFMPDECSNCYAPQHILKYQEPRVDYDFGLGEDHCVTGNADGIIHVPWRPRPGVIDIKTIKPEHFKSLEGPSPGYVMQANLYAHLLGLDWAVILYVNKSSGEEKEFELDLDPKHWWTVEGRIGSIKRFVRKVEANKGKADPTWLVETRGLCTSRESWFAKRCHQAERCFDLVEARKGKPCSTASTVAAASLGRCGKRLTVVRR